MKKTLLIPSFAQAGVLLTAVIALSACGQSSAPTAQAELATDTTTASATTDVASAEDASTASESDAAATQAAELAAKEAELAEREASLALKEREADVARREAELAAKEKAARAAPKVTAAKPPKQQVAQTAPPAAAPVPRAPLVVPSGTQLSIELVNALSTKTATVGDRVDGRLTSDVMVDGKVALAAGTPIQGSVTEVVSGSKKIGGTPTLGIVFDQVDTGDGSTVTFRGKLDQVGKSETARDTAKIAGGAVAGAVIGHQVDGDKGKIIGGILGGAAGALAAKKTGGDVSLAAGTVMAVELTAPLTVRSK
ncbi:MAG TPA: glycine zipper 2TM domain-containing protein [Steroidobacteraceae bacterium]|nr:glycine zipper 2TM domain-containing protein [Steroidobacteraceae bacterium]HRX88636.1 glycine zipper 2TM domain-containing protein [Steroidobacteraceae bacterium]